MHFHRICVFCSSNSGNRSEYRAAAEQLAAGLVRRGIQLVDGGGNVGLMGVLTDAVLELSGIAIVVIAGSLMAREVATVAWQSCASPSCTGLSCYSD